jgi:competence protein ComGC
MVSGVQERCRNKRIELSMRQSRSGTKARGFTLIEMMIVMLIIGLLSMIMLPNIVKGKYQTQWSACVQYERNLAAALESYQAQEKSYPANLEALTNRHPVFINSIPKCPSDGSSSYSTSYAAGNTDSSGSGFDNFTISCPGRHNAVLPFVLPGYPQYNAEIGLRQQDPTR